MQFSLLLYKNITLVLNFNHVLVEDFPLVENDGILSLQL